MEKLKHIMWTLFGETHVVPSHVLLELMLGLAPQIVPLSIHPWPLLEGLFPSFLQVHLIELLELLHLDLLHID